MRRRLFAVLDGAPEAGRSGAWFQATILLLIVANVTALILETVESFRVAAGGVFDAFEIVSVVIFTMEYLARVWVCVEQPRYARPVIGRLLYAVSPLALVDLFAILPFYLPAVGIDLRFMRLARFMRLMRIAKLGRYSAAVHTLGRVVSAKRAELATAMLVLVLLLVVASTLVYHAEHDTQPERFSSIPATMWWAVATLTTVGYGDVFPVTPIGKTLASVIAILGIGLFALPTGILGAGFIEELQKQREDAPKRCPKCGAEI